MNSEKATHEFGAWDDNKHVECGFCFGTCKYQGHIAECFAEYKCKECGKVFRVMEDGNE